MKHSYIVVALCGLCGGLAQAQSSVTVYGSIDGGVRNLSNANADGDSKLSVGSNGTYNPNRLGFKGIEDLGGGLNAHFVLESGFNGGTGALDNTANTLFNRAAYVGIGGSFGSIDLGRQYTVAFKTMVPFEPLRVKYIYIALAMPATAGVRNNNDIQYAGTFGPLTLRAGYAAGEVAGSTAKGATKALGLAYTQGPLYLGTAYTRRQTLGAGAAYYDYEHYTVGGAYSAGRTRFTLGYTDEKQATATVDTTNKYIWAGVNYALTPLLELSGAYYTIRNSLGGTDGKKDLYLVSATYSLSKRTNLYAELDRARISGTLMQVKQSHQTGFSMGIAHQF